MGLKGKLEGSANGHKRQKPIRRAYKNIKASMSYIFAIKCKIIQLFHLLPRGDIPMEVVER